MISAKTRFVVLGRVVYPYARRRAYANGGWGGIGGGEGAVIFLIGVAIVVYRHL
jgi:hypothetical protein